MFRLSTRWLKLGLNPFEFRARVYIIASLQWQHEVKVSIPLNSGRVFIWFFPPPQELSSCVSIPLNSGRVFILNEVQHERDQGLNPFEFRARVYIY